MMKMNEDYEVTESQFSYKDEDDLFGIRLLTGEFSGVEYTYGTINFADEENSDGTYSVSFNYEVRNRDDIRDSTETRLRFESVIGDVLNSVLMHSLEAAKEKYEREARDTNSQTSD